MKAFEITKPGYYWRFDPRFQVVQVPDWSIVEVVADRDNGPLRMYYMGSDETENDLAGLEGEFHGPLSPPQQFTNGVQPE